MFLDCYINRTLTAGISHHGNSIHWWLVESLATLLCQIPSVLNCCCLRLVDCYIFEWICNQRTHHKIEIISAKVGCKLCCGLCRLETLLFLMSSGWLKRSIIGLFRLIAFIEDLTLVAFLTLQHDIEISRPFVMVFKTCFKLQSINFRFWMPIWLAIEPKQ